MYVYWDENKVHVLHLRNKSFSISPLHNDLLCFQGCSKRLYFEDDCLLPTPFFFLLLLFTATRDEMKFSEIPMGVLPEELLCSTLLENISFFHSDVVKNWIYETLQKWITFWNEEPHQIVLQTLHEYLYESHLCINDALWDSPKNLITKNCMQTKSSS